MSRDPIDDGPGAAALATQGLSLAYDDRLVVDDLSLSIPHEAVTVIVGANACGKSTLLRGLARLLAPRTGTVLLDGHDIHRLPTREVATRLGILPQQPIAPEGISVADLVARGRHPHQRWFRQWSTTDEEAVDAALGRRAGSPTSPTARSTSCRAASAGTLWIALTLAQGTEDPCSSTSPPPSSTWRTRSRFSTCWPSWTSESSRTIVLVLHDLNLACRYAHHLVAMRDGTIVAEGAPAEVITPETVEAAVRPRLPGDRRPADRHAAGAADPRGTAWAPGRGAGAGTRGQRRRRALDLTAPVAAIRAWRAPTRPSWRRGRGRARPAAP